MSIDSGRAFREEVEAKDLTESVSLEVGGYVGRDGGGWGEGDSEGEEDLGSWTAEVESSWGMLRDDEVSIPCSSDTL
jgi:hypothetical protein